MKVGKRTCCVYSVIILLSLLWASAVSPQPGYASYLSDDEIIAAAKLIKDLTTENESLRRQVDLLEEGLVQSEKLVQQMSVQVQAWTALQESRNKQADDTIKMLVQTLNTVENAVDRIDRQLSRAEAKADFWRSATTVVTIGAAIAIGSK
jgi:hypothetical protein